MDEEDVVRVELAKSECDTDVLLLKCGIKEPGFMISIHAVSAAQDNLCNILVLELVAADNEGKAEEDE